jgi:ribosome-binding factor A
MTSQRGFARSERVGQQIHELVARLLITEVDDPRLARVQVTEVDVSPNLRNARVFYILLEGGEADSEIREALEGVTGWIRKEIGANLRLKYVPDVEFRFDEAMMRGRRIDDLLTGLRDK